VLLNRPRNCEYLRRKIREQVMNKVQTEKVRKIVRKMEAMHEKHEVGGWIEKDHIYVLVRPRSIGHDARQACLFAIDLEGHVKVYRNYAPLQLRNDNLFMSMAAETASAGQAVT
jgi:hypothetical protein